MVVSGLRRGGSTYYALDVTQPDTYDSDGEPTGIIGYVAFLHPTAETDCGPIPYPVPAVGVLTTPISWRTDPHREIPFDLDFRTASRIWWRRLVDTQSRRDEGLHQRLRDCDPEDPDASIEDRYVAIVGGGLDKTHTTGQLSLYCHRRRDRQSIYKRELVDTDGVTSGGSAPAEPAAVDTDGDGYIDRIYVGTTQRAIVYRVELRGIRTENSR